MRLQVTALCLQARHVRIVQQKARACATETPHALSKPARRSGAFGPSTPTIATTSTSPTYPQPVLALQKRDCVWIHVMV